jgi:hypothetical protein
VGLLRFYRHVLWLACRHSLGVADASFYGVLVVLALAAWWRPELPETIGLTERQISLYVFGTVIAARLLMAPYWAYREVAANVPFDADVSGDWKISEALDYIVNDSVAELKQPAPPQTMEFGPMKGKIAVEGGVEHGDARAKINEALISGELKIWGLRKINTHIPNQFELSRREIPKGYWDNMQLDFLRCMYDTENHPQTMIIPGKPELDHWTGLRVSMVQVKTKMAPKVFMAATPGAVGAEAAHRSEARHLRLKRRSQKRRFLRRYAETEKVGGKIA